MNLTTNPTPKDSTESSCTESALVIHSHADSHVDRLTLPFRLFTVRDVTIKIHQAFKSDGSGGTVLGHGASVYPSSVNLSYYLEHHARIYDKTVLELGGGHGFSGVAAAVCGARSVVTTDGDDISLTLTQRNIVENNVSETCRAMRLLWGEAADMSAVLDCWNGVLPDIIIGSDITACPYGPSVDLIIPPACLHNTCYLTSDILFLYIP